MDGNNGNEQTSIMPSGGQPESQQGQKKAEIVVGHVKGGLVPTTFDQLYRISVVMSKSGMMPKGLEKPEQIFVAGQMGLELGLSLMQSVQNIAVINGRPTLWGDAVLGLVLSAPVCEYVHEEPVTEKGALVAWTCTAKRKDSPHPVVRTFRLDDAKRAKLMDKSGPWQDYPSRMCQMRARSWALRDAFADVLKGLAVREEIEDVEVLERTDPVDEKTQGIKDRLAAMKNRSADVARFVPTITLAEGEAQPEPEKREQPLKLEG